MNKADQISNTEVSQEELMKKMSQARHFFEKCWADNGFKQTLMADPVTTLKAEGADFLTGGSNASINVFENTGKIFHLVIPSTQVKLSDDQLEKQPEPNKSILKILAKCWVDESFKQKLLTDPIATLIAEGQALPASVTVKVLENTDKVFNLIIPQSNILSDEDLDMICGGLEWWAWLIIGVGIALAAVAIVTTAGAATALVAAPQISMWIAICGVDAVTSWIVASPGVALIAV